MSQYFHSAKYIVKLKTALFILLSVL